MRDQRQPTQAGITVSDVLGTPEKAVGRRVKALREARGWSQQELATRMSEQGFSWRQTSVAKTEAADRPIRVNEVARLAAIFGVAVTDLLTVPIDDYDVAVAAVELAEARGLATAAQERVAECERRSDRIEDELAEAREEASAMVERLEAAQQLYEAAVKNGKQEHQEAPER